MMTLRGRLTLWVAITLVGIGASSALIAYASAAAEARALLDDQLRQVGSLALIAGAPDRAAPRIGSARDPDDELIIAIRDATGALRYASDPDRVPPARGNEGFSQEVMGGVAFRTYRVQRPDRSVVVAQAMEVRQEAALAAALGAVGPILIAIPLLVLALGIGIRRSLAPLDAAVRQVAARAPDSLAPLALEPVPAEIAPLVSEIDRLIGRLRGTLETERRFLADAAHALRTPIAALQLQADVFGGARTPAEQAERAQELAAGVRRVGRLVRQLLALARQDAAAAASANCVVGDVLAEVLETYAPVAQQAQVALEIEGDTDTRCRMQAPDLALALGNLLDNAIRVSAAGATVNVLVQVQGERVVVEVHDRGPGLRDTELERVFERFYQATPATGGAGLGLATVRQIAERYGGHVLLANRPGGGLTARLALLRLA